MEKAYLILQNGSVFEGKRFGAAGEAVAELVFATGVVGYLETLTDPSYHGQMVVQTFPLIGNYGVIPEDFESDAPRLTAYIAREWCDHPSNFREQGGIDGFLRDMGVIGLYGVDTREITRQVRESGAMNAAITDALPADIGGFARSLAQKKLSSDVSSVTCKKKYRLNEKGTPHIAVWDFGCKRGIMNALLRRNCALTVFPAGASADEILAASPDGVLLSNGPGDPAVNVGIIEQIKKLAAADVPMMGICLGHQMMAIAAGFETKKLKYGHRGGNQPVRDIKTGRLYSTSQNHGYEVCEDRLPEGARVRFINLNDGSCEGIEYPGKRRFSVQFHPEACCGPTDTGFLFDDFLSMTEV